MDWGPIYLSLQLALTTTILLLVITTPIAYWLAFSRTKFKPVLESLLSLPIVLPPSVLGFYLLFAFSPNSGIGLFLKETFGFQMIFTFEGLVIASVIYSLPFMVHPLTSGFRSLNRETLDAARVFNASRWKILKKIMIPNMMPSIISGVALSFAHTLGEFGVILMIGGSIKDKTRVASIAIYEHAEMLQYNLAHQYSLIIFGISFSLLLVLFLIRKLPLFRFTS